MRSTLIFAASLGLVAATPIRNSERAVAIDAYDYAGCFTEATVGRALVGKVVVDDLMTTQKCAASCVGFKWFGTEYGRECYCGNSLADGSKKAPEVDCSFACPGDGSQQCGAGNRLTTYALTGTTTPYTTAPAFFKSIGCYTESPGGRALTGGVVADDSMTIAKCSARCAGFVMFGLEYGRECFCGDSLSTGSIKAPESECSFPCSGSSTQLCGAGNRLNVYTTGAGETPVIPEAITTYNRQGCYQDNVGSRALPDKVLAAADMTIAKCAANCKGFAFFGTEYANECWCGNAISVSVKLAGDSECSFVCAGDATQKCGAGDRLDVYKFGAVSPTSSTTITVPAATSSTTVSTSTTTTTTSTVLTVSACPTQVGNLLANPGFENQIPPTGYMPWWDPNPSLNDAQGNTLRGVILPAGSNPGALCGTQAARYSGVAQIAGAPPRAPLIIQQFVPTLLGNKYKFSASARRGSVVDPSILCTFSIWTSNASGGSLIMVNTGVMTTAWTKSEGWYIAQTGTARVQLQFSCPGKEEFYVDEVSFAVVPF